MQNVLIISISKFYKNIKIKTGSFKTKRCSQSDASVISAKHALLICWIV